MTESQRTQTLITGGAGFIGSHLAEHLTSQGHFITVVDDFSTGRRSNLRHVDPTRIEVIEAPVEEAIPEFDRTGRQFDYIFHLAAAVGVAFILEHTIRTIESNIIDSARLLRYANKTRTPTIIASSSEVYGKSVQFPFSEENDLLYGATSKHRWAYAMTKAIDEYLGMAYHRHSDLPVVLARFFNTVGPRQVGVYGMVLPRFVAAALNGEPLQVYGDGTQTRCFCDVRDVVPVLPILLERPSCYGRVFNVGTEQMISIEDLARKVIEVTGSSSDIVCVPYSEAYPPGFEDLRARQPDLSRIRSETGFNPKYPLIQTIQDIADEIRESLEQPSASTS